MENYSLSDLAAATNGGGFGGSESWVLIILFALIFGGNGLFGGNAAGQAASTADLQRAVDLNSIQSGQAGIAADVQRAIYEINGSTANYAYNNLGEIRDVGAAVSANGANIINALTAMQAQMQNCCCETKQAILENRYLDAQNTAAINANTTAQVQKVLDQMSTDRINALQAEVSELKTQNLFCGIPRVNPYMYTVQPACSCSGNI